MVERTSIAVRARLVPAPGHHLVEAQPDAGERHGSMHEGARIRVYAEQERAVLLRCGGDQGNGALS